MNYKELQNTLRDLRDNFGYPLCCALNEKKEVLQAVYDRYLERSRSCPINSPVKPHSGFDSDIAGEHFTCGLEEDYTDSVVIYWWDTPYTVTFSNIDTYQSASFQAMGQKSDGSKYPIVPFLSYIGKDREKMDIAWELLPNHRKRFYGELALHFELPKPKVPINYVLSLWSFIESNRVILVQYVDTVRLDYYTYAMRGDFHSEWSIETRNYITQVYLHIHNAFVLKYAYKDYMASVVKKEYFIDWNGNWSYEKEIKEFQLSWCLN